MTIDLQSLGDNICLSGGAEGSDLQWGMVAGTMGFSVIHWGFKGHRSNAPKQEIVILTDDQLKEADPYLITASKSLKRRFPPKTMYTRNLLRRNYYQVAWSDSVYAVSTIKDGFVQGGTGWAVQLFLDRFNQEPCPCYVFCQESGYWYEWKGFWEQIYSPPVPKGIFAGIGTRELAWNGKLAIRVALLWKRPNEPTSVFA